MKTFAHLVCTALWAALLPAYADDLRVIAVGPEAPPAAFVECFHAPVISLPAVFLRPAQRAVSPVADVYLDGGKLGVLLQRELPFRITEPASHPALLEGAFEISDPKTDAPVRLRVVLRDKETVLRQVSLHVLPKDALRRALEARTGRVVLFGEVDDLRELFLEWKLLFDDAGRNPPVSIPADALAIGRLPESLPPPKLSPGASLLLVRRDSPTGNSHATHDTPGTRMTLINDARGEDWRTSPRLHRLFLNHLETPLPKP